MTLTQQTEHKSTACKAPRKQLLNNAARKSAPTTLDVRSLIAIGLDLTVVLHEGTTCASDTSKNKPVLIRVFGIRQATADKSPRKHDDNKAARKSAAAMGGVRKSPYSMPASQRGSVPNPSPSEVHRASHPSIAIEAYLVTMQTCVPLMPTRDLIQIGIHLARRIRGS
ncbi:hypothetical protein Aperf_G00000048689 [Anoplocephala perfoliata]